MEGDAQPRRYAKACDACYRKKIRCVYRGPACELCRKSGIVCKFTKVEKAQPKPARRKNLTALEARMKEMETLFYESRIHQTAEKQNGTLNEPVPSLYEQTLTSINSRDPLQRSEIKAHHTTLQFAPKPLALRLAQGYFATANHVFPIFNKATFMQKLQSSYPPNRDEDFIWYLAVVVVLCYAHRLRGMSTPGQADAENEEACRYLKEALDLAPRLTYTTPSLEAAQVLLGIASTLRGTKIANPAPMLAAAACRMLQCLDAHLDDADHSVRDVVERKLRERAFWIAYILDKDDVLQTRKPPVLHDEDIGREPLGYMEDDGVGLVRSLDGKKEVNMFAVNQRLASIQAKVWSRAHAPAVMDDRLAIQMAQAELNPILERWRNELPFQFKQEDLVGRWPKFAIIKIVVLHFAYFQTLVELNKVSWPEQDYRDPLYADCPIAKALPLYPHSTMPTAVEAARNALDLASLTPRGNYQCVWLFFTYSISAVLTLLVNGIIRPLNEHAVDDLCRVDVWLQLIDYMAKDSERPDLLEKRDFLDRMRQWTLRAYQEAVLGQDLGLKDMPCIGRITGADYGTHQEPRFSSDDSIWDAQWLPEFAEMQSGMFGDEMSFDIGSMGEFDMSMAGL